MAAGGGGTVAAVVSEIVGAVCGLIVRDYAATGHGCSKFGSSQIREPVFFLSSPYSGGRRPPVGNETDRAAPEVGGRRWLEESAQLQWGRSSRPEYVLSENDVVFYCL